MHTKNKKEYDMKGYQTPEVVFTQLPVDLLTASIPQPYGEDIEEWGDL